MMSDRAVYANANCFDLPIADKSVQMIATSPPYWGLRSYDTGDMKHAELGAEKLHDCLAWAKGEPPCGGCYVCNMRTWARECWRVLRDDGTLWLNLADSYAGSGAIFQQATDADIRHATVGALLNKQQRRIGTVGGLKTKDLCGIPQRVVLALQSDGWYWRSDIVWAKPNPMPESVLDRPTKAHEYIFLLTKGQRYFWDADGVREAHNTEGKLRSPSSEAWGAHVGLSATPRTFYHPAGRNLRTVWTVATAPYSGAHYAVWPPALVERMIKAGSRPGDIVLDPFAGSGTTLMVARQLGRIGLGFDLSEKYLYENCRTRLGHDKLAAWGNGINGNGANGYHDMPLFARANGNGGHE